jgi:hypothetical protein
VVSGHDDGTARSLFAWWVVAPAWEMPVQSATVRVQMPAPSVVVRCRIGGDAAAPCSLTGAGTSSLTLTATYLLPHSGVELAVTTTAPPSARVAIPWSSSLDPVIGSGTQAALVLVLVALVLAVLGRLWAIRAEERPPATPVQYRPPDGLGPVQVVYLATETTGTQALTSTLFHLAERGLVRLEQSDPVWSVERVADQQEWEEIDPVTRAVGRGLWLLEPGDVFRTRPDEATGAQVRAAIQGLEQATRSWALSTGLWRPSPWEWVGRVLVVLSLVVALMAGLVGPALYSLPFLAFSVAGAGLLATGTTRRRTPAARELWARALGFQRLLTTPSSEDRFDYAAGVDVWMSYLPYAVAFGAADAWAAKYRTATGVAPPLPTWYPATGFAPSSLHPFSTGIGSFGDSIQASVSAYSAAHSGGGGGFGGGFGGGGGGGGGSW